MIKKLIVAAILITILCMMAEARMPQKGDAVKITVGEGITAITVQGIITDIENGLICLNSTWADTSNDVLW